MIDWTKPLCTKHETPHIGQYLGPCQIHPERRRVAIFPPSLVRTNLPGGVRVTVFRYDDDGSTRGDGKPSLNDLVNYDPNDGAVRINHDGSKVVCSDALAA